MKQHTRRRKKTAVMTTEKKWDIVADSVAWTILIIGGLLSWPVIAILFDSISVFVGLIVLTGMISIILTSISWIIRKLFHKETTFFKAGLITHFGLFISSMILLSIPMWAAIIINSTIPVTLPTVTMTNGEKTVTYQGMMHIGSENYYKSIIFDMVAAADFDYLFFYEGVTDGSEENEEHFSRIMGLDDESINDTYVDIATICDLSFQGEFFWVFVDDMIENSEQHVLMDVSIDDMMTEWDHLLLEHPEYAYSELPAPLANSSDETEASEFHYDALTNGQKKFMGRFCQAFFSIAYVTQKDELTDPFMREVILDFRDRHLADGIIDAEADKIFVTYGSAHFPGVYAYLKEDDPNWEIVNVRWKRALELSQDVEGTLDVER